MMNKKLSCHTEIHDTGLSVGEYWSWAYSDILTNRNRGIFAEFLVGHALDVLNEPRMEWDGFDLHYKGKRIEVKSSAYLQSWHQSKPSIIRFDIAPKKAWDARSNTYSDTLQRHSDCYVFCLFATLEESTADVLDLNQWDFYVISTKSLNDIYPTQKSLGFESIKKIASITSYAGLKSTVDTTLG